MIVAKPDSLSSWKTGDRPLCLFAYEDAGLASPSHPAPAARRELLGLAQAEGFKGALGECVAAGAPGRRHVLVGLGKKKDASSEQVRRAAGSLFHFAKNRYPGAAILPPPGGALPAAEGLALASYRFDEYRKPEERKLSDLRLVYDAPAERARLEKTLARAALSCQSVGLVRDWVNRGPSDKTPQSLADWAKSLEGKRLSVTIINRKAAAELGMGAFLGVARGSSAPPVFIHCVYKPAQARKRVALVGKGITFDSGGLSLKPAQSMETMKTDMTGAATVLGVMKALPQLAPKAEVHGICAVTYNMPGPDAMKPGDVVKAMNGKTIEVLNTDAEGRLVLADALSYAVRQKPDAIIDIATLTGAVITALGNKVSGAMTNNKTLLAKLMAASGRADEPIWELPLVRDYKENIKSSIADLQNIGKRRGEAGTIIGGLFLEEFVDGTPWVHLDIAGTDWSDGEAYCSKGGTGVMVRTLLEFLASV